MPDQPSPMNRDAEHLITVCAVIRNDRDMLEAFVRDLSAVLARQFAYYEIVLVDNHSSDDTLQLVRQMEDSVPNLRLIRLSRVHSLETAITAALDNSIGDFVVLLEPRYDDLALIAPLVEQATGGYDIVVVRPDLSTRYDRLGRWFAGVVYALASKMLGNAIRVDDSRYRVYSRRAVNALAQIRRKRRYLKYSNTLIGYSQSHIDAPPQSASSLRKPINRLESLSLIIDLVISNSAAPLRMASLVGLLASFLSLLYIVYIIVVTILRDDVVEGWLTTNTVTTTLFFMLFIILTIMSEYIARILVEAMDEPLYFIESESNSRIAPYTRLKEDGEVVNVVDS